MSIPLDRLYQYIENIAKEVDENIIIYRFWPHGSKKLENLKSLRMTTWKDMSLSLNLTCHDQEPLHYGLKPYTDGDKLKKILLSLSAGDNTVHNLSKVKTIYTHICLLHSEKRSEHVIQYQNNRCVPVYYWSHALIALDWFRYAQHILQNKTVTKKFLVYNRAWSGTREYRLQFADLMVQLGLDLDCRMSINPVEPELGIHYDLHEFSNSQWRPTHVLENYFTVSDAHSHYSADFDIEDYEATDIEVVLETLFDDPRLHLTEKSLRPIACGQPFILAGTHGSLEYLRSYGFKTFDGIWNEQYDTVKDPYTRLIIIADEMRKIANWSPEERASKLAQAQAIADHNRQHFFSQDFFDLITSELRQNLIRGIQQTKSTLNTQALADYWSKLLEFKEVRTFFQNPEPLHPHVPSLEQFNQILDSIQFIDKNK